MPVKLEMRCVMDDIVTMVGVEEEYGSVKRTPSIIKPQTNQTTATLSWLFVGEAEQRWTGHNDKTVRFRSAGRVNHFHVFTPPEAQRRACSIWHARHLTALDK